MSADTSSRAALTVLVTHGADAISSALVRSGTVGGLTGPDGSITLRIPPGPHSVVVSRLGFAADTVQLLIFPGRDTTIAVDLAPVAAGLAPVIVGASRVERRVQDEPERVEVLSGEDVGEKTVMHPASPTTLLSEMPGVRVQTTSPGLGGAGVRLQGLRGRYTLLLADGLPLYGSASEGLGFLQVPPLDLAQAEVIKGAATALYGPAAAGGVLNLISRRPPRSGPADRELLLNQTSRRGTDGLIWLADSISSSSGYTFIAGAHNQTATDVDGDNWAEIPGFRRFEARPRMFWKSKNGSSAIVTLGAADERRHSGFVETSAATGGPTFPVAANTRRADAGAIVHLVTQRGDVFSLRSSANQQWQDRRFGDSTENDRRGTFFGESSLASSFGKHQALFGAALQQDGLSSAGLPNARYQFFTQSLFGQETFTPGERLSLSGTVRLDHHNRYGTFFSPRISALVRFAPGWAARASAGRGVFAPTPLVEEADVVGLARVRGFGDLAAERVTQGSADLTRTMGPTEITGTLFHSVLADAVVVRESSVSGTLTLMNAPAATRTSGATMFAVYNREPLAVSALYSYTRSREWSPDKGRLVEAALTPRHSAGLDIAFDEDDSGTRAGIEVFYTGRQALDDNPYSTLSAPYTTIGILVEQKIGPASIFVNGENLTGVRQTHFDPLLLPRRASTGRWTTSQWAPLEGRTFNAGVRVKY
jgi:outer membrane receptor for ferrienterochelin and colicins